MTIKITASTMGVSTPASVGNGKPYRWRGLCEPGDPRYREAVKPLPPAMAEAVRAKAERFREFCQYRDDGASVAQAARLIEVSIATARTYERERKEQQREGGSS